MTWTLVICAYLTTNGCGHTIAEAYSNRTSCYRALEALRFSRETRDDEPVTIAYCVEGGR